MRAPAEAQETPYRHLPPWFKVPMPGGPNFRQVQHLVRQGGLHTVCQEARCPNIGECWEGREATFMVMGDICTRNCLYCAVRTGRPDAEDPEEPRRLARAAVEMGLRYCVITSVARDDLSDGGANTFAECIREIRKQAPGCRVEVLIPDFQGDEAALKTVTEAAPNVLNHNIETVRRTFHRLRPRGDYDRSLELLAGARRAAPGTVTKSGMMVGLGEEWDEIVQTMTNLRSVDCDLLTIGQYLRPSRAHHPVSRFYTPEEFDELRRLGERLGFRHVSSGPLVRSSYHAREQEAVAARRR